MAMEKQPQTLSDREIQRRIAKRVSQNVDRRRGVKLSAYEVFVLWQTFMDHWRDLADDEL